MLTIEDIRNPKRKSGFDHVQSNGNAERAQRGNPWVAAADWAGTRWGWRGPRRATAEEAAQDYCDYINNKSVLLTIEDLRNPKRKSGFDHVNSAKGGQGTNPKDHGDRQPKWRGEAGRTKGTVGGAGGRSGWRGPTRQSAEEAAQDYCDYINGQGAAPAASLKSVGHEGRGDQLPRDSEVEAALGVLRDARAQRRGRQGYVYLIGVKGDDFGVKLGYSVKPPARCGELQTGNPRELVLLAQFEGTLSDEKRLHARYIKDNLLLEWFSPSKELFDEFGLPWPYIVGEVRPIKGAA